MKKWRTTFSGMITTLKSKNISGLCQISELAFIVIYVTLLPSFRISRAPASPTASGPDSERVPSPERERRQALEYEEEDAPPEISVEVKEAHVTFPNLPVPKSSDGNVSFRVLF